MPAGHSGLRPRRRDRGPSPSAARFVGLGDGGALAGRTYIHQLPQTPPRWRGSSRACTVRQQDRHAVDRKLIEAATAAESYTVVFPQVKLVAGPGFEPG